MNKYEKLIEHIINDDEAKARELFHQIVVEKSREIYESLMDEEYTEEDVGGDQVEDLVSEIGADETDGIGEGDDEDNGELDMDLGDEEGMDDMGMDMGDMGDEDLESKVMDLESELEALKAEFEQLMGDEEGEEDDMDMDNMDMDDSMSADMDDMDDSDKMMEASDEDEDEMTESKDEEDEEEKMSESVKRNSMPKTAVDLMREYVEKISAPSNTEFTPVGTGTGGDKPAGNTKNPLAGKNDMGGNC
jgi:hypothetical protein